MPHPYRLQDARYYASTLRYEARLSFVANGLRGLLACSEVAAGRRKLVT